MSHQYTIFVLFYNTFKPTSTDINIQGGPTDVRNTKSVNLLGTYLRDLLSEVIP